MNTKLEFLPFEGDDMENAHTIARAMGYGDNTAYQSTSAIPGLCCMASREHPNRRECTIAKTKQFGLLIVSTLEDLKDLPQIPDNWQALGG